MSLKAKLEAVIYAAEEPVTLAQLAALFAADALEWKAGQAAAQAAEPEPAEPLPQLEEGFAYLELEQTPAFYTAAPEAAAESEAEPAPDSPAEPSAPEPSVAPPDDSATTLAEAAEASPDEAEAALESGAATQPGPTADSEGELRRQARAQDREVRAILLELLQELIASCAADDRGIEIREIAGGYRMATKPECHDAVRALARSLKRALKLSLPALETLAVIAYKQPVTAPEVNEIRGVESSATLGSLLSRKLIATAGRKPVIGRPILYKTTREFLLRFGLKDVSELPSMEEFEKMAAIELDEAAAEGAAAAESGPEATLEFSDEPFEPDEPPAYDAAESATAAAQVADEGVILGELGGKDPSGAKARVDFAATCGPTEVVPFYKAEPESGLSAACAPENEPTSTEQPKTRHSTNDR